MPGQQRSSGATGGQQTPSGSMQSPKPPPPHGSVRCMTQERPGPHSGRTTVPSRPQVSPCPPPCVRISASAAPLPAPLSSGGELHADATAHAESRAGSRRAIVMSGAHRRGLTLIIGYLSHGSASTVWIERRALSRPRECCGPSCGAITSDSTCWARRGAPPALSAMSQAGRAGSRGGSRVPPASLGVPGRQTTARRGSHGQGSQSNRPLVSRRHHATVSFLGHPAFGPPRAALPAQPRPSRGRRRLTFGLRAVRRAQRRSQRSVRRCIFARRGDAALDGA